MNKEILFFEGSWDSAGSDELEINIELKSNNEFNFFFAARTNAANTDLSIKLFAEVYTTMYVLIKEELNTLLCHISTIVQSIAKGKYQIILINNTASACVVKYRYQFTQK